MTPNFPSKRRWLLTSRYSVTSTRTEHWKWQIFTNRIMTIIPRLSQFIASNFLDWRDRCFKHAARVCKHRETNFHTTRTHAHTHTRVFIHTHVTESELSIRALTMLSYRFKCVLWLHTHSAETHLFHVATVNIRNAVITKPILYVPNILLM